MKSLGIELKGNLCIAILCEKSGSTPSILKELKLELKDSYDSASIQDFYDSLKTFLNDADANIVTIKKRNEKGKFAGGAVSFKMEGIIQLIAGNITGFVTGAQLNKISSDLESSVKKYQLQALLCSIYGLENL